MGMILTGRLFSAREAYNMGLVNEVAAESESVVATAERWDHGFERWQANASGRDFVRLQTALHEAKKALESLDEEHEERMDELRSRRQELQLLSYLDHQY